MKRRQGEGRPVEHVRICRVGDFDAAGELDVVNPLANVVVVLAGEVALDELPQEVGRAVLFEVGGLAL